MRASNNFTENRFSNVMMNYCFDFKYFKPYGRYILPRKFIFLT